MSLQRNGIDACYKRYGYSSRQSGAEVESNTTRNPTHRSVYNLLHGSRPWGVPVWSCVQPAAETFRAWLRPSIYKTRSIKERDRNSHLGACVGPRNSEVNELLRHPGAACDRTRPPWPLSGTNNATRLLVNSLALAVPSYAGKAKSAPPV